ncbi:MAG: hypothetical protein WAT46_10680 [Saprospiraceae bacterium]
MNGKKTGSWYHIMYGTGMYKDDKMDREWKVSNKEGQLTSVFNYKNGKKGWCIHSI